MTEAKKHDDASGMKGDLQQKVDKEQDQGFVGTKVDPRPNSDYSLESGPDSPPAVPDDRTAVTQQHVNDAKAAKA